MRKLLCILFLMASQAGLTQPPVQWNSAEIGLQLKKLGVLGSVLYIAAHPDDENTRLLAYMSKEKLFRTGYLSITRGDGGQNLIGDEQGIELGLVRTQELLAARRIDGAEQFFTRAFDFGFSKSTTEALQIWDSTKILADVVWVIRNFRPDVIITRFPEDNRAGHGHHSASAVLARKAFVAAADSTVFPEQFRYGVGPWQAKRILWNTFNFGSTNTTSENQFKLDVGAYIPLLGKSFGEIAAESRSQHKSQGFGVPASRGVAFEYFVPVLGDAPVRDLLDGVNTSWDKLEGAEGISKKVAEIIQSYDFSQPHKSVHDLVELYQDISSLKDSWWKKQKLGELARLVEMASGLYLEASTPQEYAVQGDSLRVNFSVNNRSGVSAQLNKISFGAYDTIMTRPLATNQNLNAGKMFYVPESKAISQPYWLNDEMEKGHFTVSEQQMRGRPENLPSWSADFVVEIDGIPFTYTKPVMYKRTDPVKGELFQPVYVVPPVSVNTSPGVLLFRKNQPATKNMILTATAYTDISGADADFIYRYGKVSQRLKESNFNMGKGMTKTFTIPVSGKSMNGQLKDRLLASIEYRNSRFDQANYLALAQINYDHIPSIRYFYPDGITILNVDVQTSGKNIGYIRGAGDRIPEALEQLGYQVSYLGENDMQPGQLSRYDAIVTGVRAYNVHEWLNAAHDVLMEYVRQGGNLIVQYNTNNFIGPVKAQIGPNPFSVSRNRVTDENSPVTLLKPAHPLLSWPNRIGADDFEGWVQERGIYFAEQFAEGVTALLGMKDPGEQADQTGSLIVSEYGKGRFIYTGLAFFRQLPAGVPGAYRLFANLVSNPNAKINGTTK